MIFRGEGGREELGEALRARGAEVTYAECYRRAAPATGAAGLSEVLSEGRAHALTLTSSEGLDNLCAFSMRSTRSGSGSFPRSRRTRALRSTRANWGSMPSKPAPPMPDSSADC